jgi:hypothetical protein
MFSEKEVRKEEPPVSEDSSNGLSPGLPRALSHPTIRSIALMLSEKSPLLFLTKSKPHFLFTI